jgi:hypothetical protein
VFVRFKTDDWRLKAYVVESVRRDGQPRQASVAYLGGIGRHHLGPQPNEAGEAAAIQARTAFWDSLGPRLTALPETERLRLAVEARIPCPTEAERDRLGQLAEIARALREQRRWERLHAQSQDMVATLEQQAAEAAAEAAQQRAEAAQESEQASMWQGRVEALRRRLAGS